MVLIWWGNFRGFGLDGGCIENVYSLQLDAIVQKPVRRFEKPPTFKSAKLTIERGADKGEIRRVGPVSAKMIIVNMHCLLEGDLC